MRKLRVSVLVAGLMVVGAACSSSGDGGSAGSAAPSAGGSTAVSEAPVTDASVVSGDTAAPTPPVGGDASCLPGTWLQGPERLQAFLGQIGTPLSMTVLPDSLMTLTMSGDSVTIVSTITLQAVMADTTMQMTGSGNYSGTFSADGGSIDVVLASQEYTAGDWLIMIDGNSATAPGMTPVDLGPPINGIGTYTCTDTTLEVVAAGGRTSTFDRG